MQDLADNKIVQDIQLVVNFLSAAVGIVVVGVIILGGIQYMTAGDNPQAVSAAKQRITNGLLALLAFIFMFAILQWLIPGGIFNEGGGSGSPGGGNPQPPCDPVRGTC